MVLSYWLKSWKSFWRLRSSFLLVALLGVFLPLFLFDLYFYSQAFKLTDGVLWPTFSSPQSTEQGFELMWQKLVYAIYTYSFWGLVVFLWATFSYLWSLSLTFLLESSGHSSSLFFTAWRHVMGLRLLRSLFVVFFILVLLLLVQVVFPPLILLTFIFILAPVFIIVEEETIVGALKRSFFLELSPHIYSPHRLHIMVRTVGLAAFFYLLFLLFYWLPDFLLQMATYGPSLFSFLLNPLPGMGISQAFLGGLLMRDLGWAISLMFLAIISYHLFIHEKILTIEEEEPV